MIVFRCRSVKYRVNENRALKKSESLLNVSSLISFSEISGYDSDRTPLSSFNVFSIADFLSVVRPVGKPDGRTWVNAAAENTATKAIGSTIFLKYFLRTKYLVPNKKKATPEPRSSKSD
ncbi:MAG: hypothetical protein AB7Q37_12940 [Pyrinomonadaceae bacterium]